jgi:hypothetical protein
MQTKNNTSRKSRATSKTPAQLTPAQIEQCARAVTLGFSGGDTRAGVSSLMLLLDDLMQHCFDSNHVNGVAITLSLALFSITDESNTAMSQAVAQFRRDLTGE